MDKRCGNRFDCVFHQKFDHTIGFYTQRIVVWGMKCVSYDHGFEVDLATKWQELEARRERAKLNPEQNIPGWFPSDVEDSDYEDEAPSIESRDHLWRKAKHVNSSLSHGETASVISVESSEGEEDFY